MSPQNKQDESSMGPEKSHPSEIELQLSESLRRKAEEMAAKEGISLEDFILYAVAEKVMRSEPPNKA